jgi:VanZ family protein
MAENTSHYSPVRWLLTYWGPVLAMFGLMYFASTDALSGENTRSIIEHILLWFTPNANPHTIRKLNFIVRKAAHFTEYALLAWLIFRALRGASRERWRLQWAVLTVSIIISWSLVDEWHQTFTRTRGGSVYDSLLDSTGGLFVIALITIFHWIKKSDSRTKGASAHD